MEKKSKKIRKNKRREKLRIEKGAEKLEN